MSHGSDWPLDERIRVPVPAEHGATRRARPPRTPWLLAGAAFAAGVLLTAILFSAGWRHQAQHGSAADAALAAATARARTLHSSLTAARAAEARTRQQLAAARKATAAATGAARSVSRQASGLATELVAVGKSADSVSSGSATIGANVDKLAGELKTLASYLTTTPPGQLDPGYVATQTAYLTKQLDELKATRSDLASAVADFDSAAKSLADRAAKLSGSD